MHMSQNNTSDQEAAEEAATGSDKRETVKIWRRLKELWSVGQIEETKRWFATRCWLIHTCITALYSELNPVTPERHSSNTLHIWKWRKELHESWFVRLQISTCAQLCEDRSLLPEVFIMNQCLRSNVTNTPKHCQLCCSLLLYSYVMSHFSPLLGAPC